MRICRSTKAARNLLQRFFRVSLFDKRAIAFFHCSRMEEAFRSLSRGRLSFVQKLIVVSWIRGGFRVSRATFPSQPRRNGNVFAGFDSVETTISITLAGCQRREATRHCFLSLSFSIDIVSIARGRSKCTIR